MVESKRFFFKFIHPLFVCFAYLFLYMPILILAIFSFNDSVIPGKWVGFSLRWYQELFKNPDVLAAFKTSIIVAACSTGLSVILGTCFVIAHTWSSRINSLTNLFYANIILPEIILGIGILSIFTLCNIPIGYPSLITGHTLLGLGFVVPIVNARYQELDPILTEVSLDLGANYLQTFRKVLLPLLMPSLIASSLLVFTLSLDDFLISFFCSGPTVQTLAVYVYSTARSGINPTINAISAILLAVSSLVVLLLCFLKVIDQVISHD